MLSSKIFEDVAQTPRVRNNPHMFLQTKSAAVPLSVLGFSFIYYLIGSKHRNIELATDLFGQETYNPIFNKLPFVKITHDKSFTQPINKRLIEYYTLEIWVTNDKQGKSIASQLIQTVQSKMWGIKTKSVIENNRLKVLVKCYLKTYLFNIKSDEQFINEAV
jgi:hypothetical protein